MMHERVTAGPFSGRFDKVPSKKLFLSAVAARYDSDKYWERIEALQRRGGRSVFHLAAAAVAGRGARLRCAGADVLAQLGAPKPKAIAKHAEDSLGLLVPLLPTAKNPMVAAAILTAIGHLVGSADGASVGTEGVTELLRHSASPDWTVRSAAAFALSHRAQFAEPDAGADRCLAGLCEMVTDPKTEVRDWVSFYLEGMIENAEVPDERVIAALRRLVDDPDPTTRVQSLKGLAMTGDQTLVPRVADELGRDPLKQDLQWVDEVLDAAELLGSPDLLPALISFRDRLAAYPRWAGWLHEADQAIVACVRGLEAVKAAASEPNS